MIISKLKMRNEDLGSRVYQYVFGFCACFTLWIWGAHAAWSSPSIVYLTSENSTLPITDEQAAWIISIYLLGDLFGGLINPFFIDQVGRKYNLFIFAIPGLISFIFIIFAENHIYLYVARFIAGIGQGSSLNSLIIYLSEIADKHIRGTIVNLMLISLKLSYFLITLIAAYTSYDILNFISVSLPIISLLISPFLLESPYFYLMIAKEDNAIRCLMKLRGVRNSQKVKMDVEEMKLAIEDQGRMKKFHLWDLLNKKHNRRALLIVLCMKMTQYVSGVMIVASYAQEIFGSSNPDVRPGVQAVILEAISISGIICTNAIIDRFSRRFLFLSSGIVCTICLFIVGLSFLMQQQGTGVGYVEWLPLVSLSIYAVGYGLGIGTIPNIVQGELFPMEVKGIGVAFGMTAGSIMAFFTTAVYKASTKVIGITNTFWILAAALLSGSFISFWLMFETRATSLEEIQAMQNPEMKGKLEVERKTRKRSCENNNKIQFGE